MPDATVFDSTDKGTLRPNKDPLRKQGSAFKPMQLTEVPTKSTTPLNVYKLTRFPETSKN